MASYFYRIYGLIIESSVELTELERIFEDYEQNDEKCIDVIIQFGKVQDYIHEKIKNNILEEYEKENSWFCIEDIAIYQMTNGNKVTVESLGGTLRDIKSFLLGSALGCILIQRDITAIHGSTIVLNDKAVILTGESGAGKSTLASAFRIRGYKFLSDDVSAIEINNRGIIVNPAYPQQKLCRDAAMKLGLNLDELEWIDEDRDKFAIPFTDRFEVQGRKLKYIFEISISDQENVEDVQVKEVLGVEKIELILNNIYRIEYVYMMGNEQEYLKQAVKIAERIKCFNIIRSNNTFTLEKEMEKILEKVKEIECGVNI